MIRHPARLPNFTGQRLSAIAGNEKSICVSCASPAATGAEFRAADAGCLHWPILTPVSKLLAPGA
jgi:hypothetical protein